MEKIILGGIEKHLEDSAVIGHSQHSFMRWKSCLSNLISFYDKDPSAQNVQHTAECYVVGEREVHGSGKKSDSDWGDIGLASVTSGVPQGSILGIRLMTFCLMASHDTKLGGADDPLEGREALQRDLDK
ncbi:hypothetical protein WISP_77244 [Willisornis vidua]|uniref:Uncharacterized protein n=1 Tax=Willisornis vidua TaxID=1566151 RepID=A0ABQ9DAY5_9PASS|nr:hypothetical protein WISP_77244 [Willisornis vidua]